VRVRTAHQRVVRVAKSAKRAAPGIAARHRVFGMLGPSERRRDRAAAAFMPPPGAARSRTYPLPPSLGVATA